MVGTPVTVAFLAARRAGTIVEVSDGGRHLLVRVEETGEEIAFALSRATGRFMRAGRQTDARLLFEDPDR